MRLIIFSIILIMLSYNCDAYSRKNGSVSFACIKNTYTITHNKTVYDCLIVNKTDDCNNLENFTEYQELKNICINNSNNCVWLGILIAVIGWMFNWDNILIQNR